MTTSKTPTWSLGCHWLCWFLLRPQQPRSYSDRASQAEPQRQDRPGKMTWSQVKMDRHDQIWTQWHDRPAQDPLWLGSPLLYYKKKTYASLLMVFFCSSPLSCIHDPSWYSERTEIQPALHAPISDSGVFHCDLSHIKWQIIITEWPETF